MLRRILLLAALCVGTAFSACAQDYVGRIVDELHAQGFEQVEVQRTLLGRARILAETGTGAREIVVNPNTGEILRDLWDPVDDAIAPGLLDRDGRPSGTASTGTDKAEGTSGKGGGAGEANHEGSGSDGDGSGDGEQADE